MFPSVSLYMKNNRDALHQQLRTPSPFTKQDKPAAATASLPPEAKKVLKEGIATTFKNGEVWTLKGGQEVRVQ